MGSLHVDHVTVEFPLGPNTPPVKALSDVNLEIQSGEFANKWMEENRNGRGGFLKMRESQQGQQLETIGKELREMMPFLKKKKEAGIPQA